MNKVALITGSREGIGFQTALQLATRNWTVLMADKQDLQESKDRIKTSTPNSKLFTYYLDLGSFSSVRQFASKIKQTQSRLHVLINNAGIFEAKEQETVNHLNPVMQVNHLGSFLLTVLLTDLLKASKPSSIIFVASSGAFLHTLDKDHLPVLEKEPCCSSIIGPALTYYNSKLCNMIVSKEFATRLEKHQVTSNCLHPGMTNSNFLIRSRNLMCFSPLAYKLFQLITQNPKISGQMVTSLATSKTFSQITGEYFVNYQISQTPKIVDDVEYRAKIWKQAEETVGLTKKEKMLLT